MPILVDSSSKVICYGMETLPELFHMQQCLAYGTNILGGIASTRGDQEVLGRPLFSTVREARKKTGCTVAMIATPPKDAAEAMIEAAYAGVELLVCLTKKVPFHDMVEVFDVLERLSSRVIGPESVGIISPGQCKVGTMPGYLHKPGCCGILSTSGTLMYEAVLQTTSLGIGQSTCVDVGKNMIVRFVVRDILNLFNRDPSSDVILVLGPLSDEELDDLVNWTVSSAQKPVVAYMPGQMVTHKQKKSGVFFVENSIHIGEAVQRALS